MAEITLTAPDEHGEIQRVTIEYAEEMKGGLVERLARHFSYPATVEEDGRQVANPQSKLDYIAHRIISDLIRLAMQEEEQAARTQAAEAIKHQLQDALAVNVRTEKVRA